MTDRIRIRWGRALIAGMLAEISIVLVIGMAIGAYAAMSPAASDLQAFTDSVATTVGVFGGAFAAILFAMWAGRRLRRDFIPNGVAVGVVAAILHLGLVVVSGMPFKPIFLVADALKLAGGALGGILAQRRHDVAVAIRGG